MGDGAALHQRPGALAATALPLVRDGLVLGPHAHAVLWLDRLLAGQCGGGADAGATACCATFAAGADEGAVEASAVHQLQQALRQRP